MKESETAWQLSHLPQRIAVVAAAPVLPRVDGKSSLLAMPNGQLQEPPLVLGVHLGHYAHDFLVCAAWVLCFERAIVLRYKLGECIHRPVVAARLAEARRQHNP